MSTTPILQFGTSRFLQAHFDLFISEARAGEQPIVVVQSSGDPGRARRIAALAAGYDVHIRGLSQGRAVDTVTRVTSVARGLSMAQDAGEVARLVAEEAQIILSNTADAGFRPRPEDQGKELDLAMSYPAKLAHLLRGRYEAGGAAPQIMPTELVQNNGSVLRGLVMDAAGKMDGHYREWLADEVIWVNSLVDRIVSEPIEPAGAVAEPYALWAIEAQERLVPPASHPDIHVVEDLGRVERRKLFVLNLGHSWMVSEWLTRDVSGARYVRDVMADADWSARLRALYAEEVTPGFEAAGESEGIAEYIAVTLDRFANPYLDHRLEDIAQNHAEKLTRRIEAFLDWARANGDTGAKPQLERAMAGGAR